MQTFRADVSLDRFFRDVSEADRRALILDYDGTLAPFRRRRGEAVPWPGVREAVRAILRESDARLAIVSGRTAGEVAALLGIDPPPEIWGAHGWQRRVPDGTVRRADPDERALGALARAREGLRGNAVEAMLEEKPGCLAIHWRGRDDREIAAIRDRYRGPWTDLAARNGLALVEFDGGLELRARGRNKGFAVRTIRTEMGAGSIVAALGDDATDEDAFRALGERDLGVLVRREARPTAADIRIEPPAELLDFLERWHDATERAKGAPPGLCGVDPAPGVKGGRM